MAITNPANFNTKDGLPSIASAMNQGANPTAQPSSALEGIAKMGIGYANPGLGAAMAVSDTLNASQQIGQAGGPAFTQSPMSNLAQTAETMVANNPITSRIAGVLGFNPQDMTDPTVQANQPMTLEDRYASNAAALADFNASRSGNAGIDALNQASGNIGRQDYQGAPQSAPPNMLQQRADILGNITQVAQQSLAQNAGNVGAPVSQSSISTTPSIAGSIAQAGQATTARGGPAGMSLPTSKPSMPGTPNTGLNIGNIPGVPANVGNMTFDLSGIASQIAQATGAGDPSVGGGIPSVGGGVPVTGGGTVIGGTGVGRQDYQGAPIGGGGGENFGSDIDSGDFSVDNSSAASFDEEGLKYGGIVLNQGGSVGYQTNDTLKDLMRGYF